MLLCAGGVIGMIGLHTENDWHITGNPTNIAVSLHNFLHFRLREKQNRCRAGTNGRWFDFGALGQSVASTWCVSCVWYSIGWFCVRVSDQLISEGVLRRLGGVVGALADGQQDFHQPEENR